MKTKLFKSYMAPIFLYNSEVWTLTNNMDHKVPKWMHLLQLALFYIMLEKNSEDPVEDYWRHG